MSDQTFFIDKNLQHALELAQVGVCEYALPPRPLGASKCCLVVVIGLHDGRYSSYRIFFELVGAANSSR